MGNLMEHGALIMRKPIYKRRWFRILAVLFLIGLISYWIYYPAEYQAAQRDGYLYEATYPSTIAEVSGIRVVTTGNEEGPTLFLLHGSPGHWQDYGQFLLDQELTDQFLLVVPDRPGYGGTDPGKAVGSVAEQAKRLVALTEGRPRPWIWVGHSFGATVAARIAMDFPDQVDGMVLAAGAMSPEYEQEKWYHSLGKKEWIRRRLPEEIDVSNQEALAFISEFEDMVPMWEKIVSPTLIIHGTADWMASPKHVDFAVEEMTNAEVEVVLLKRAGHLIIWARYDDVKREIMEFANSVE